MAASDSLILQLPILHFLASFKSSSGIVSPTKSVIWGGLLVLAAGCGDSAEAREMREELREGWEATEAWSRATWDRFLDDSRRQAAVRPCDENGAVPLDQSSQCRGPALVLHIGQGNAPQ